MLLTVKDAAACLNTTERHLREMIYQRRVPFIKVGRLVRIDSGDLDKWIDSRRVEAHG